MKSLLKSVKKIIKIEKPKTFEKNSKLESLIQQIEAQQSIIDNTTEPELYDAAFFEIKSLQFQIDELTKTSKLTKQASSQ
jgi:hypothetical protein